jgi:putative ABC transport system permease protein
MRINLALLNILHEPRKTALALAGIGIAILLIFMQLGFRGAVEDTATNIYGKLDFDVLLRSADYLHFIDSGKISRDQLDYVAAMDGVRDVNELNVSIANWRNPENGITRGMMILGVQPTNSPFRDRRVDKHFELLKTAESALIDQQSHPEFGPLNERRFSQRDIGRTSELSNKQIEIVQIFSMGAGLAANGAAIVSQSGFERVVPQTNPDLLSFGLITVSEGHSPKQVAQQIREALGTDSGLDGLQVLTRQQVIDQELQRWLGETPIGFIFTLGVLIAMIVGAAIVYMVLGNDVANRLHEYATMRAMGYSNRFMGWVVIRQSIYLALCSFVPALILSLILYWLTSMLANLSLVMDWERVVSVLLMTLVMCGFSGVLAIRKLWKAEPAELF